MGVIGSPSPTVRCMTPNLPVHSRVFGLPPGTETAHAPVHFPHSVPHRPIRPEGTFSREPGWRGAGGKISAEGGRWRRIGLKAREVTVTSHPRAIFFAPLLPGAPSPLPPPVRPRFAGGSRYSGGALYPPRCCDGTSPPPLYAA